MDAVALKRIKETKRNMSKTQRTKGRAGEQEIVNLLKAGGLEAKRISMMETGGIDKGDIKVGEWIGEVKRGSHVPRFVYKALEGKDILFMRRDRKEWLVTIPLEQWLQYLKK